TRRPHRPRTDRAPTDGRRTHKHRHRQAAAPQRTHHRGPRAPPAQQTQHARQRRRPPTRPRRTRPPERHPALNPSEEPAPNGFIGIRRRCRGTPTRMPTPPVAGNRSEPGASPGSAPKAPHRIQPVTAAWSRSWRASATVHTGRIYGAGRAPLPDRRAVEVVAHAVPVPVPRRTGRPEDLQRAHHRRDRRRRDWGDAFGLAGGYALSGRDRPPRGSRWRSVRWVGSPVPPHHTRVHVGGCRPRSRGSSGPGTFVWALLELTWRRIDSPDLARGGESRRRSSG